MTERVIPSAAHLEMHDCGATDHFHLRLLDAAGRCFGDVEIRCEEVSAICDKLRRARERVQFGAGSIHHTGSA